MADRSFLPHNGSSFQPGSGIVCADIPVCGISFKKEEIFYEKKSSAVLCVCRSLFRGDDNGHDIQL